MCSQRHHPSKELDWRGGVNHPSLDRPRTEARCILPLSHTDGSVLVPAKSPVRVRRLVEENGPDRPSSLAKNRARDCADAPRALEKRIEPFDLVEAYSCCAGSDRLQHLQQVRKAYLQRTGIALSPRTGEIVKVEGAHCSSYAIERRRRNVRKGSMPDFGSLAEASVVLRVLPPVIGTIGVGA